MKNKLIRAVIAVFIGIIIYFIGEALANSDVEMGLAYVAGVLGAGLYWIGSKE